MPGEDQLAPWESVEALRLIGLQWEQSQITELAAAATEWHRKHFAKALKPQNKWQNHKV